MASSPEAVGGGAVSVGVTDGVGVSDGTGVADAVGVSVSVGGTGVSVGGSWVGVTDGVADRITVGLDAG